jgi:prevent-host-death family protein
MEKSISAADANREFSRLLRAVREGERFVVTVHGTPVARIVPIDEPDAAMLKARAELFAKLRRQKPVNAGRWTRDELYDHDK